MFEAISEIARKTIFSPMAILIMFGYGAFKRPELVKTMFDDPQQWALSIANHCATLFGIIFIFWGVFLFFLIMVSMVKVHKGKITKVKKQKTRKEPRI